MPLGTLSGPENVVVPLKLLFPVKCLVASGRGEVPGQTEIDDRVRAIRIGDRCRYRRYGVGRQTRDDTARRLSRRRNRTSQRSILAQVVGAIPHELVGNRRNQIAGAALEVQVIVSIWRLDDIVSIHRETSHATGAGYKTTGVGQDGHSGNRRDLVLQIDEFVRYGRHIGGAEQCFRRECCCECRCAHIVPYDVELITIPRLASAVSRLANAALLPLLPVTVG